MGLHYENLDSRTRAFMIDEVRLDASAGALYLSPRLTDQGRRSWQELLTEAVGQRDDDWLALRLRDSGHIKPDEPRRLPRGGYTSADVPVSAAETLAEGEFNRFYMRGLCARALAENEPEVEVCRGGPVADPRPSSEDVVGRRLAPGRLLEDLRGSQGAGTALGVPGGPNSTLTIRLP